MNIRTILLFTIAMFLISCNYLLAETSPEKLFHLEMHKLTNFKQAYINGKIVYTYTNGQIEQSFQLNFKEGVLIDGAFFIKQLSSQQ